MLIRENSSNTLLQSLDVSCMRRDFSPGLTQCKCWKCIYLTAGKSFFSEAQPSGGKHSLFGPVPPGLPSSSSSCQMLNTTPVNDLTMEKPVVL